MKQHSPHHILSVEHHQCYTYCEKQSELVQLLEAIVMYRSRFTYHVRFWGDVTSFSEQER